MQLLDLTFDSPAENLACDEALLNLAEAGDGEILRFWEPSKHFVVTGYANRVGTEVNLAACAAKNVPIYRRCSGGGTVLQGPGCLNYSLVLQIAAHSSLTNISCTNRFVMERNRDAIEAEITRQQPEAGILVCGHTDLALVTRRSPHVTPRKCSGNSQRRHKRALLFHGTFLLQFNLSSVAEFLQMPSKQPDYRQLRSHRDFLTNLALRADQVKAAMQKSWNAESLVESVPIEAISRLAREKYGNHDWNFKF